jgi:four helix bundle protein
MQDFRNLKVWHKAHALALRIYQVTAAFPREEQFGLTSQMRRSASSIPMNLAEGCGRGGDSELARFARISMGSASELEYQLVLAKDLGFIDAEKHAQLDEELAEVKRMLAAFINGVLRQPRRPSGNGRKFARSEELRTKELRN